MKKVPEAWGPCLLQTSINLDFNLNQLPDHAENFCVGNPHRTGTEPHG